MFLEIELKLAIIPSDVPLLHQHYYLLEHTKGPSKPQHLISTYFDSDDQCLWKEGLSLRIREDSKHYIQTAKTTGTREGDLHRRYEWEQDIPTLMPDIKQFNDKELYQKLDTIIGHKALIELFRTEIYRTQWDILINDSKIELVLDQGYVIAGAERMPLHEIELELKYGDPNVLNVFASILRETIPLSVESCSKAERGYALCARLKNKSTSCY